MSTGTWREIDVSAFFGEVDDFKGVVHVVESSAPVILDGIFYWQASLVVPDYRDIEGREIVMSFDMGDEVFRRIRMPGCEDVAWDESVIWQVSELKDKLAVFIYLDGDNYCEYCDVWVLNEDQSSWTNQFKIGSFPWLGPGHYMGAYYKKGRINMVGCAKNGELVVVDHKASGDFKLFSFDLETRETADLYFGRFRMDVVFTCILGPSFQFQSWKAIKSCSTRRTKKEALKTQV